MALKYYRLGLTGYPLGHSMSPLIHQSALAAAGLEGNYQLYPITHSSELPALLQTLRDGELDGLNVTIPYKQIVASMVDQLTVNARLCGAVNTLYMRDNQLIGDNTDVDGFMADLLQQFSGQFTFKKALILGAGGAARAVIAALLAHDWQVTVVSRRADQAQEIVKEFSGKIEALLFTSAKIQQNLSSCGLLVNATPVGMFPDMEGDPLPADVDLPAHLRVYDLVYNPRETGLIKRTRQARAQGVTGLGMLVEQAALAFEKWTGVSVNRKQLWKDLENELL
jgi:shikimate dehydrogenase